jgi:hypothetical protein
MSKVERLLLQLSPVTDALQVNTRWAEMKLCLVRARYKTPYSLSSDFLLVSWLVWRVFLIGKFVVWADD